MDNSNLNINLNSRRFNPQRFIKKPRLLISAIVVLIIIGATIFGLSKLITKSTADKTDVQVTVQAPQKTIKVNREFGFPIKDEKGVELSKLKYSVESAELASEIIIKGQKATAVSGRIFLILNLKIVNDTNKKIQIDTRDYIRLSVNNNDKEQLAPDIHNDPVEVQALSTKYTRLGFPINTSDKNLKLRVGEINGDKSTVDLKF